MNRRKLTPEILDDLPADDPDAIRSRRDLIIVNLMMGNYRWLSSKMKNGETWLELGAGAGTMANHLKNQDSVSITGVDFAPRPDAWPEHWAWHQGDLFAFLGDYNGEATGIAASLFLHHFSNKQLGKIGESIPDSVDHLVFSEPARYFRHKIQAWLGFPLFNHVTRHDMIVSIEAGFRGSELAESMLLDPETWDWKQNYNLWGAYRFEARRK